MKMNGKKRNGNDPFQRVFGPSPNSRIALYLEALSACALKSTTLLSNSKGSNLGGVIELEHEGDDIVRDIYECMDGAFILRFDKSDIAHLVSALDDIIDGTRKVATHISTYGQHITPLRIEAKELMDTLKEMTVVTHELVGLLAKSKVAIEVVRPLVDSLGTLEQKADAILARAEKKLVQEYGKTGENAVTFIGLHRLFILLERATDHANHCGIFTLSIARKEA
jgi:uncharacterized protein Yka (UPF0111/DUF47 family)